jgi:hypothetical protein
LQDPLNRFDEWLEALEARHLANLTRAELTRALRALSSCYVERRGRIARGAALDGAGKRAAFALFYAPLLFLTVAHIIAELGVDARPVDTIVDLGCGTGAAGAAWALACAHRPVLKGIDRNPWAVQEANWTYRQLGLTGRAVAADITVSRVHASAGTAVLLAYAVNELPEDRRALLLERTVAHATAGADVLIVEPIARGVTGWWNEWSRRFADGSGRVDEWRFPARLPPILAEISRAAGLRSRELTARTIFRKGAGSAPNS